MPVGEVGGDRLSVAREGQRGDRTALGAQRAPQPFGERAFAGAVETFDDDEHQLRRHDRPTSHTDPRMGYTPFCPPSSDNPNSLEPNSLEPNSLGATIGRYHWALSLRGGQTVVTTGTGSGSVPVVLRFVRTLDVDADVLGLVLVSLVSEPPRASTWMRATFSSRCLGRR